MAHREVRGIKYLNGPPLDLFSRRLTSTKKDESMLKRTLIRLGMLGSIMTLRRGVITSERGIMSRFLGGFYRRILIGMLRTAFMGITATAMMISFST